MEGALFRTEKDNARETDPTNSNNIVGAGNQLVKGLQFSAVGRLPEGMNIVAGYAYLDSAVIFSKFFPQASGLSTGECAEADVQFICDASAALAVECGAGRELCGEQDGEFYCAVCSDRVCAESEWAGLRGDQCGDETGAWLLGIQRDAATTCDGQAGVAGECV